MDLYCALKSRQLSASCTDYEKKTKRTTSKRVLKSMKSLRSTDEPMGGYG